MSALLQRRPPSRARSQIRPAIGVEVRHRLRIHVHEYELPPGVTRVGRDAGCRIVVEDPTISREHAEIVVDASGVTVRDLGSRNGTWVDGARIDGETELADGARLRLGTVDIQLVDTIPRAPLRSTLRLRACTQCAATFAYEERACPACGAPARDEDWLLGDDVIRTPADERRRRSWWLELLVDLLERALSLWRLDDAQRVMQRIEEGLDERGDEADPATLDRAYLVAVRLSAAQGDAAWIRWMLQAHVASNRVPSRDVVDKLRALPAILLEDARPALESATRVLRAGDEVDAFERLDALRALGMELDRLRDRLDDRVTDRTTRP